MTLKEVANVISGIGFEGAVVTAVWMYATMRKHSSDDLLTLQAMCLTSAMAILFISTVLHRYVKSRSILDASGVLNFAVLPIGFSFVSWGIRDGAGWKVVLGTLAIVLFVVPVIGLGLYRDRQEKRKLATLR